MWREIRSYTCHVMQERRVCVTNAQSHKKHHCIVTNREDVRVEPLLQQLIGEYLQHHTTNEIKISLFVFYMFRVNIVISEQHPDCCSDNTTLSLYNVGMT